MEERGNIYVGCDINTSDLSALGYSSVPHRTESNLVNMSVVSAVKRHKFI
jgi:hypothetical protein